MTTSTATPTAEELKAIVREKYTQIAQQPRDQNAASCCGIGGCEPATTANGEPVYNIMAEDYTQQDGYVPDADLGLGCGLPTEFAGIQPGHVVLDLGSGAGNDAFIARRIVGEQGKVLGVDFTPAMIEKARANADKLGYHNVEFRQGDIEALPVGGASVDVVVSNCVLNLVPNKAKAFAEMFRVLKPGGHFCVSDIVLTGDLPPAIQQVAELYAGCVSGAIRERDYLKTVEKAGFTGLRMHKRRDILVPDNILLQYISPAELAAFRSSGVGIVSITLGAYKPVQFETLGGFAEGAVCDPAAGCC